MTRTWIVGYLTVAALAVFRILGSSHAPASQAQAWARHNTALKGSASPSPPLRVGSCSMKRTDYHVRILGIEWVKTVRETPMSFMTCPAGRGDGGTAGGEQ